MKTTPNQSQNTTIKLHKAAELVGIQSRVLLVSKPRTRRYSANGSTFSAQKVIELNGIRMSLGQAKQYIAARA